MHMQVCTAALSAAVSAGCSSVCFSQVWTEAPIPDLKMDLVLARWPSLCPYRGAVWGALFSGQHTPGRRGRASKNSNGPGSSCFRPEPSSKSLASCPFPVPKHGSCPPEARAHLVKHILKLQLQVAEQAGRQGKLWQRAGQTALQVTAERTTAKMLQGPGLPHQGKEGGVEPMVLLETGGGIP